MKTQKGDSGLMTEEQFHSEAVQQLLNLSNPVELKHHLSGLMEKSLQSETFIEFPEQIQEHYYSYRVMHNFLVQLIFLHTKNITAKDLMLNP